MQVLLQITGGPATGRRFRLRQGQIARIGRTAWADFSVPDDGDMADVHFELGCNAFACWLRRLDAAAETLRNGEAVEECRLRNGDSIAAGQSHFLVTLDGVTLQDPSGADAGASNGEPDDRRPSAESIAGGVELSPPAQQMLAPDLKADSFLDLLIEAARWDDAARFLARWLGNPQAVAWGCACLQHVRGDRLNPAQQAALAAAESWAADCTESNRRAAQQAAEAIGGKTPAGWLALAAFWSEGSVGPPDAPCIPAAEGMSAKAVATAVVTVAGWNGGPALAPTIQQFLEQGRALLSAEA